MKFFLAPPTRTLTLFSLLTLLGELTSLHEGPDKALITEVALVGFVSGVDHLVFHQSALAWKTLPAVVALKRLLTCKSRGALMLLLATWNIKSRFTSVRTRSVARDNSLTCV